MKRSCILFPLFLVVCLWTHSSLAASDPSDSFVQALLASQSGEKLAADGKTQEALIKFRFAAGLLDQIKTSSPKWQPLVREYRSRKTAEYIADLEATVARDPGLLPGKIDPSGGDSLIPGVTEKGSDPIPESDPAITDVPSGPAGSAEAAELRRQVAEARLEIKRQRARINELTQKYELSSANLRDALKKVDQSRVAVAELRSEFAKTEDRLRTALTSSKQDAKTITELKKSVVSLEQNLAERTADAHLMEDDANDLAMTVTEVNQRASAAEQSRLAAIQQTEAANEARDKALADLAQLKIEKEEADKAIVTNAELAAKLDAAGKQIAALNQRPQASDLESLKAQITSIQAELASAQEQSKTYASNIEDLKLQLENSNKALEQARERAADPVETAQIKSENDLLRGIVLRSIKEQIKRNQAREIVAEELARIEGKSQVLLDQVDVLGTSTLQLTDDERKLFKEPEIAALDAGGAGLSVEMTQTDDDNVRPKLPLTSASPTPNSDTVPGSTPLNASPTPPLTVPDKYASLVSRAKDLFDKGKLTEAKEAYKEILNDDPNNLYALSNLGVVHYKAGELLQSEKALVKAAAIAPKDFFVNCTLGIVYYRQGKFEKAIESLTTAVTIDPKSATAHNYLGISASQKGWAEAAVKELEMATTLNPSYPDAWFNLSVIYSTMEPPSLDKARECYRKAIELGAQPDPAMEKLLK